MGVNKVHIVQLLKKKVNTSLYVVLQTWMQIRKKEEEDYHGKNILFPSDLHPHYLPFISQWYCYYGSISIFVIHFHCLLLIIEITRTKWYIRLKWTERHGTRAKNGGKGGRQIVLFPSILAAVKILFQNNSELDFT